MSRASYDAIDYNLRPAKAVERKMLADMLRRLDRLHSLKHYRYVGFGSPYFADFSLFHRLLDIQTMVSIEREAADSPRFEFNKPFGAVQLLFGESSEVLPEIGWNDRSIVWLDYDDPLQVSMLDDIQLCVNRLASGSIILISASAQLDENPQKRVDAMRENLGEYAPPTVSIDNVSGWDIAGHYREVIDERFREAVRNRNAGASASSRVAYQQLVNFQYADGAKMMTVGGVVVDESEVTRMRGCGFDEFSFYRATSDPYRISVPMLTPKEVAHLNSLLPSARELNATDVGIPQRQSSRYASLYRYFPRFVDAEG